MRSIIYIRFLFLAFVASMVLAMVITYCIDPYRIFLTPEIEGINKKKPFAQGEIFFNRLVGIQSNKPRTILLGNSRVQWGLSAKSDLWPTTFRPVYNAAIPGANTQTALAYLEYAAATGNIKTVLLGLDYFSFLIADGVDPEKPVIRGNYKLLLAAGSDPAKVVTNYFTRLASIDSLADSLLTIIRQKAPYGPDILPNGDNPLKEYEWYASEKGYHKLFKQYLSKTKVNLKKDRHVFFSEVESSSEFEALNRIINLAEQNNIHLYIYFQPYHTVLQDLIISEGRREEYQKWRGLIIHMVNGHKNLVLWDFGGRNAWTSESVPEAGDTVTQMKWYWEPGHYKKALGEKIIGNLIAMPPNNSARLFGVRIYPE